MINVPTSMSESVSSVDRPTLHVIKIRFNNIFKNEKVLFGTISVALSVFSLLIGLALYNIYQNVILTPSSSKSTVVVPIDASVEENNILNKMSIPSASNNTSQQSNSGYGNFNPNDSSLLATNTNKKKESDNNHKTLSNKKVLLSVDDVISMNPFLPAFETTVKKKKIINPNYILPPEKSEINTAAQELMKTTISGILFDKYSPSAIINIKGSDYLVKKGDYINGYKILQITPSLVSVKYGSNVYQAKVGEYLSKLNVNNTGIQNISNRFGGSGKY